MAEVPPFLFAKQGDNPSPFAYTVPGSGEVQPYTATATYTNASGQAILPALRIKSRSGNLLALVFPSTTIANGSASEVSFVPPFGSAASSAAPASAGDSFAIAYRRGFNIPSSPGSSFAVFDPWDYIDSSDGNVTLNGAGQVTFNAAGLYETWTIIQVLDSTWLGTDIMNLSFNFLTGGPGNDGSTVWPGNTTTVGPTNPSGATRSWQLFAQIWVNIFSPPEATRQNVFGASGGAAHTATNTFASMSVKRMGPPTPGGVS